MEAARWWSAAPDRHPGGIGGSPTKVDMDVAPFCPPVFLQASLERGEAAL
jgi:hypothetical protein